MNCAFDKEKLTGYYDGELGTAEKAEVERHIASCSECLRDLGDLKSAALLVKELPRLRAPASIAQGVSRELQAAGKVHVFAKFRRALLWGSAAAAGLFIAVNAMYFGSLKREAPMASQATPLAPMARALPRESEKAEPDSGASPFADRKASQNEAPVRRELMERKSTAAVEEQDKQLGGADALKKADSKDEVTRAREKSPADAAPSKPMTAAPVPAAAPGAPATPPPPAAELPKPAAVATPAPTVKGEAAKPAADKELPKVEQAAAPKPDPAAKPLGAVVEARAELAPIHCTLSATQLAKARPRLDEALKKMGVAIPAPPPAPTKAPRRDAETVFTIEISDAQLAALREELEKPGDAKLQQSNPVDPVLPQFRSGGIFSGGKKDAATAGAPAGKAKAEAPKEVEGAAAEPRRKVTLHLVEVKTLPADADDRAPSKK